jgi:hypothetical protein
MTDTRFRHAFLLLLVVANSIAFVAMVNEFLLTILLAAIFTGLSYPVYPWLLVRAPRPPQPRSDRLSRALAAVWMPGHPGCSDLYSGAGAQLSSCWSDTAGCSPDGSCRLAAGSLRRLVAPSGWRHR